MKIYKLSIENFRSYETKTEFKFKGESDINIILGQNGTGKTSFLSAIKYVLFGPRMFGSEFHTKDYINWAKNEINFNSNRNKFEISLQFTHNDQLIEAIRSSTIGEKYVEDVVVYISGKKQPDASFLDKFNYNLYNNIFFNGENISQVTSNQKELKQFTEAIIDVYFEIDIFKVLKKDTENAISKSIKKVANNKYKFLSSEIDRNKNKMNEYQKSLQNIMQEIDTSNIKINHLKDEMKKRKTLSTSESIKVQKKVESAKKELKKVEKDLISFLKNDAHKILMNNVLSDLNEQLSNSRESRLNKLNQIYEAIENKEIVDLESINFIDLKSEIKISNDILKYDSTKIVELVQKYKNINRKLKTNETKLSQSEDGKKMIDYNFNLEFITNHVNELQKKYEIINTKLSIKQAEQNEQVKMMEIEKKKMLNDQLLNNAIKEKNNLINICDLYIKKQSDIVFHQVAGTMESILKNSLLRKEQLIDSISIIDYNLTIVKDGEVRLIDSFSAGEQQLILISLIFAVLNQARVQVPLILDTFFARIDDVGQNNLIDYLSSCLNNQILFIATDSELPNEKLSMFTNVNTIYKLENDGYKTNVGVINANKNK